MPDLTFTLPWPPSSLSPNTRQHWAKLAQAKRSYRSTCYLTAVAQNARRIDADRLQVCLEFVPPTRRKYDLDNLLARMKSGLDGVADVLGVDDSRWEMAIRRSEQPKAPGCVIVTVTVTVFGQEQNP